MTNFIPHTPEERQEMLQRVGVNSASALFEAIPGSLKQDYTVKHLPHSGQHELGLQQHLVEAASKNRGAAMESFLGGGAYQRFIPPAVNTIASRSEFYTAYTPYQPEISQGTLQVIYEFQTMMSELTGMDITNASVYDGATALSESALMAMRITRRSVLYVSDTMNPQFQQVLQTYIDALGGVELRRFDPVRPLRDQVTEDPKTIAAVMVQQPDYFGIVRPMDDYQSFCDGSGALLVVNADPVSLGILASPRAFGASIVCGDIQQFGNSVNFGGPYGGFIATTEKFMRQLPGRVVGRSLDKDGRVAYTLTLQTREQHIRREKATSNICTNQSLNVLKATVYLSLVGPQGLRQIAEVSAERAHQLAESLLSLPGVSMRSDGSFLNEFALRLPVPAEVMITHMAEHYGILAGVNVGKYWPDEKNTLLVAVTEMNSLESLKRYVAAFKTTLSRHGLSVMPAGSSRQEPMMATGTTGRMD